MNELFDTTAWLGIGSIILLSFLGFSFIIYALISEKKTLLQLISLLLGAMFFLGPIFSLAFTDKTVYYQDGLLSHKINLKDFNKIMKDKEGLTFTQKKYARASDSPDGGKTYTVKDLKNNKTYYNCTLDFSKSGQKVKLNAVTCGRDILEGRK